MKILLVAATALELQPILNERISAGEAGKNVDILVTGVGIPQTIYHLTKRLLIERYNLIIQAGIAGAFTKKIKRGEVVFVKQDTFGDLGVEENKEFKTIPEIGLSDENDFPFENGYLVNRFDISRVTQLKEVTAVTINKISDRKKQARQLKKKFNAEIETMEGAALHYVCLQQNIRFLQIRGISNYVGVRDKSKWTIKPAIENLNAEITRIINTML